MCAIERASFTDPWSERDFAEALAPPTVFLIARQAGVVTGYVVARAVADEGEILNLAVNPGTRRRGLGRALVERALDGLRAQGVLVVYLEVRESNTAARQLYGGLGFEAVARRPRYYRLPAEDAVVLRAAIAAAKGDATL